jgi:hypothetical protein
MEKKIIFEVQTYPQLSRSKLTFSKLGRLKLGRSKFSRWIGNAYTTATTSELITARSATFIPSTCTQASKIQTKSMMIKWKTCSGTIWIEISMNVWFYVTWKSEWMLYKCLNIKREETYEGQKVLRVQSKYLVWNGSGSYCTKSRWRYIIGIGAVTPYFIMSEVSVVRDLRS